jgi:hypothetical protein
MHGKTDGHIDNISSMLYALPTTIPIAYRFHTWLYVMAMIRQKQ